ncbi:hypothetical protein Barb7_02302 [Bacteroidales bacterium Barb7]|nr:hypothetical protein Barb7_02302 [Bacteroidales bacterium Barb7]
MRLRKCCTAGIINRDSINKKAVIISLIRKRKLGMAPFNVIEKYQTDTEKISKDLPVLREVVNVIWRKAEKMNENIYISLSGGKDSIVMMDIIRRFVDKNVPAVFCNIGNEYPEIVKFIRSIENVTVICPDIHIQ